MISPPEFGPHDRLIVFAPHPDDETLATGVLIQQALAAGSAAQVVILTDGDNNPWPQRWLERRWRIDARARTRWGQRRRAEARAALARLGVAADAHAAYGWPDLGVTERLLEGAGAEQAIASAIEAFAPTWLAAPVLSDRHPDHSALGVLVERASMLARAPRPQRLGFIVHGAALNGRVVEIASTACQQHTKQRAVFDHATQVSLSARRLLAIAARPERFAIDARTDRPIPPHPIRRLRIPVAVARPWLRRRELLLVVGIAGTVVRGRVPLPGIGRAAQVVLDRAEAGMVRLELRRTCDALDIGWPDGHTPDWGFAKIERRGRRVLIYDDDGWHRFSDCAIQDEAAAPR